MIRRPPRSTLDRSSAASDVYKRQRYDCWFQVCTHKSAKSSISTDLGKQFILDILPATLDEFVNWSQLGPQADRDGDGVSVQIDPVSYTHLTLPTSDLV